MSPPPARAADGAPDSSDPGPTAETGRSGELRRRGRAALERRFGVDARGLAAFRIAVGLLVVADLLFRARDLTAFYTDAGALPREALAAFSPTLARLSVHTLTGSARGQALLFLLAGCLAVAMTAGYRTRAATAGVAVLHASLYARNPYLTNGGDGLLALALFLALFLPLGERWSVDALGRDGARSRIASLATATLLAQLVVVYAANAAFKLQSDAWTSGDAVRYVLELEQFSVGLGPALTAYPGLLAVLNWLWVGMLVAAPLLVLATGRLRTLLVAGFVAAHLGMLATMRLGLFPLVVVALLLLYLPGPVWDRLERRLDGAGVQQRLRRAIGDRSIPAPGMPARAGSLPASIRRGGRVAATALLAVVLVASVVWPATALGVVDASEHDAIPATDGYSWTLFAPNPPTSTRWFVAPATLDTGERIDALDGSAVEWDPPDAAATYPSTLWHRYLAEMRWASDGEREYLAAYLCDRASADRDAEATEVAVYAVERPVESVGGGDAERTELIRYDCTGSPA